MKKYIGCDAHRRYSVFVSVDETGRVEPPARGNHGTRELRDYLSTLDPGVPVAVEASAGWYWFLDEPEAAGLDARLVNPLEAKRRMGGKNKTDKLDAKGLAILCRNGILAEVWIPPAELRDLRGLIRARLSLRTQTTVLKNQIHAALGRYGTLTGEPPSDLFGKKSRLRLSLTFGDTPPETRMAALHEWELLDVVDGLSAKWKRASGSGSGASGGYACSRPCRVWVRFWGPQFHLEIGDVQRFPTAAHLVSYAGLVPTVHASEGKSHHGPTSPQANHYLRWAFVEAAACILMHRRRLSGHYALALYDRINTRKCHGKAAIALARHLAEASW